MYLLVRSSCLLRQKITLDDLNVNRISHVLVAPLQKPSLDHYVCILIHRIPQN